MTKPCLPTQTDGFTILEVVLALLLLTMAASGVASLVVVSHRAAHAARLQTTLTALAVEKIEELRSLEFTLVDGVPRTDTSTNLAVNPPFPGGSGLLPSPVGTLRVDTDGYVDYLDRLGDRVGSGSSPPASAVFVRRWSIEPLEADPVDTLVLRAFVTTVGGRGANAGREPSGRTPGEALMVTVKGRKAR